MSTEVTKDSLEERDTPKENDGDFSPKLSLKKDIDDVMKDYEKVYENNNVPGNYAFIIRADGHSFSKFTNGFKRPFDENFKNAMIETMKDAIAEFNAMTGYTHSDEITLIFAPRPTILSTISNLEIVEQQPHIFNGRVCKIVSLVSSYISVRFNFHVYKNISKCKNEYTEQFVEKIERMSAYFDARMLAFSPENISDITEHMIWRSLCDCSRNCVSSYARQYFSYKQLLNKSTKEMIQMMLEAGFDYKKLVPLEDKIGTYAKKELYEIEAINKKTGKEEKVQRSRIVTKTVKAVNNKEFINLLLAKYW